MGFQDRRREMIKNGEGCIPHMYLDSRGFVTVAVGQLLRTVEAAQELAFVSRETGEPATAAEIAQDYETVKRNRPEDPERTVAGFYKRFTSLELPQAAIDALLDRRIDEFEAGLRADFPDYDTYSDDARFGLMDMAFNLGNAGLVDKFPTFTRAAREKDWAVCARECKRRGIGDARNEKTRKLFEAEAAAAGV